MEVRGQHHAPAAITREDKAYVPLPAWVNPTRFSSDNIAYFCQESNSESPTVQPVVQLSV